MAQEVERKFQLKIAHLRIRGFKPEARNPAVPADLLADRQERFVYMSRPVMIGAAPT